MKLTEDQIRSIMVKEGKSKTILVDLTAAEETIKNHEKEGQKLIKQSEINGRVKLTFEKQATEIAFFLCK